MTRPIHLARLGIAAALGAAFAVASTAPSVAAWEPTRTGRDHRAGRARRRGRSDGPRHPGHRHQAPADEAVDGGHQQGWRCRRRRLPRRQGLGPQSAQAGHHAVEPVHHAARHRHSVQLEGSDAGRHAGARRVRPVGQCRDALQDGEGLHRGREGGAARPVQDGRHRLQAGRPDHHGRGREGERHQVHLHPVPGGGEVAVQLVGKHVNSTVNNPIEAVAQWRGGKVRPLCVFDSKPLDYKDKVAGDMSWSEHSRPASPLGSTSST